MWYPLEVSATMAEEDRDGLPPPAAGVDEGMEDLIYLELSLATDFSPRGGFRRLKQ
jgi:hypothetical protein